MTKRRKYSMGPGGCGDLGRIIITLDLPDYAGNEVVATGALLDVLEHLRHDGIEARRISLQITEPSG